MKSISNEIKRAVLKSQDLLGKNDHITRLGIMNLLKNHEEKYVLSGIEELMQKGELQMADSLAGIFKLKPSFFENY